MKNDIDKAKKILINGGLLIFPTETVYGLGGDATNKEAVYKIYQAKNRPNNNPIICHFKNIEEIEKNFIITKNAYKLAAKFWPGPLTLILEKKTNSKITPILSNNSKFVGCRIPKHPICLKLLNNLNFPIAAPSANISTKLSSTEISQISNSLKNKIFFLDGGKSFYGLESTVVLMHNNNAKILRLGSITYEEIKAIIPNTTINKIDKNKLSPGHQKKHYSPNKPLRINIKRVKDGEALLNFGDNKLKSNIMELNLSVSKDLKEAARNFYQFLHKLDNSNCAGIAVAPIINKGLGKTLNDRLKRASFIN